jgi:hypothetical protein
MRFATTATVMSLNDRAAEDGLMCVAAAFFKDVAPDGVHLCHWAVPFGQPGLSSHFMTVWSVETMEGDARQFSMNVRRHELLALPEIPGSPSREFDSAPVPNTFPGFTTDQLVELRERARTELGL